MAGKAGKSGGGGGAKPTLSAKEKAHVQVLKKIGVEDPRKFLLGGQEADLSWQGTKGAAKNLASGTTSGARIDKIAATDAYSASYDHSYNDSGKLSGGFADKNLVGSENTVTDFNGSSFSGGGGGGDTASSTAGADSAGLANVQPGESLDDVVYGVRKKGKQRALRKAKGVGE